MDRYRDAHVWRDVAEKQSFGLSKPLIADVIDARPPGPSMSIDPGRPHKGRHTTRAPDARGIEGPGRAGQGPVGAATDP